MMKNEFPQEFLTDLNDDGSSKQPCLGGCYKMPKSVLCQRSADIVPPYVSRRTSRAFLSSPIN